ncbi:MAG: fused MFS/spermidine synthase [Lachnospiraceae bacterium]|nr:fused MFS/spermidine synthase [Lachnospiraceae bacterium]
MKYRILHNKWFLYLTEFFSGVSVMAVELGASRLLAPYFSSSQIVWTIIIGTIMIAIALGNLYGGRTADKNPDPARLYRRILIAAIWIAAIPVAGKYVILGVSALMVFAISTNFLIWAAFASCMIVFVFPLFLLGTVTPCLVKFTAESLDESGRTVGRLGACNTIGSILGTFLPTFVTIPSVGTAATFLIFAGILLALALAFFISAGWKKPGPVIAAVLFVLCVIFGRNNSFAFWEKDLVYEGESVYNYLQVKEDNEKIMLSTNVLFGIQSVAMKEGGLTGLYYDYALAAPVMAQKEAPSVLILGNGTGTFASQCVRYFPGCRVEGVEIDGKITDLAEEYFSLPESVKVTEYDGRAYIQTIKEKYDIIMVDAYQDITIPFQMSTTEFFTLVRDHLTDDGVMVVNLSMHSDGELSINHYLCDTISSVFPHVATVDVPYTTNRELFASKTADPAALLSSGSSKISAADLSAMMQRVSAALTPYQAAGHILTDDKAPVEVLGMRMIDLLISDELGYFKDIFEKEGLAGLLSSLGI